MSVLVTMSWISAEVFLKPSCRVSARGNAMPPVLPEPFAAAPESSSSCSQAGVTSWKLHPGFRACQRSLPIHGYVFSSE